MSMPATLDTQRRFYAVLDAEARIGDATLFDVYRSGDTDELRKLLSWLPGGLTVERPSLHWPMEFHVEGRPPARIRELTASFTGDVENASAAFAAARKRRDDPVLVSIGSDPALDIAEHWCPTRPAQTFFGTRTDARRLIGADALAKAGLSGTGVNVVIVDQGLNRQWLDTRFGSGRFAGGWPFNPAAGDSRPAQQAGQTKVEDARHGLMIARNVLDMAPNARLHDLPLIPPRIDKLPLFLSEADAAYRSMLTDIRLRGGNWIIANAWAVFDRRSEFPPRDYTENKRTPPNALHPFTQHVSDAIDDKIDVIFCAGNCGEFCPDSRCGAGETGMGRSIWGANSFHRVLTVGAVRADGTWIGHSSQGPGQPNLGRPSQGPLNPKPDICLPSSFAENLDAHTVNRGTSAATGIAAGIVAAVRGKYPSTIVKPEVLKLILGQTAQRPLPGGWNPRFGHGIVDIEEALRLLP